MSESKLFNALREEDRKTRQRKRGGGGLLRYVLIAGILLLLIFNLLFIDFESDGDDKAAQPDLATPGVPALSAPDQITDLGAQPVDPGSADAGNQARQLIDDVRSRGNTADPDALFSQAASFVQEGKIADAYLLNFYLAKQGHGPSTLVLAEMADPAYYDPKSSFFDAPDFAQAHKWYLQAMMLGMDKAEPQLRDLKLRVKAAAAGGDEKARRLLVGW